MIHRFHRNGAAVLKYRPITASDKIHVDQVIAALHMPRADTVSSTKIKHGCYHTVIYSRLPAVKATE